MGLEVEPSNVTAPTAFGGESDGRGPRQLAELVDLNMDSSHPAELARGLQVTGRGLDARARRDRPNRRLEPEGGLR